MGLLIAKDGFEYRRWVNIMPSVLISGGGHFLSGRKRMGLIWFFTIVCLSAIKIFLSLSPLVTNLAASNYFTMFAGIVWIIMLIESCRTPIPRLTLKHWIMYAFTAIALLAVPFLTVRQFLFQPFQIPTHAMEPTLMGNLKTDKGVYETGDHILVSKMSYWFHPPRRGDMVVCSTEGIAYYNLPPGESYLHVKRVVGIPGDAISVKAPNIFVNGKRLEQPPIFQKITSGEDGYNGYVNAGLLANDVSIVALGKDEYFVCGDNGTNSLDSRYFGAIKRNSIKGKVILIYLPFERKGVPE